MPAGGAWEVVVDKAVLEVLKYLACTTTPFLQHTDTAQRMLTLLDNSTMRDLLVERNFSGLCGMLGCGNTPQYRNNNTGRGEEGSRTTGTSLHSSDMRHVGSDGSEEDDASEAHSDDDDPEATEAFRKYEKYREQQAGVNSTTAMGGDKMTNFRGVEFMDRFCSPVCAVQFKELLDKLSASLVYERVEVLQAIGVLFPNISLAALQRLAGAESTVLADIQESARKSKHEQEGDETEASSPPPVGTVLNTGSHNMSEVLERIQGVESAWERAMRESTLVGSNSHGGVPLLSMPLMAYDFFLTISTPKTKLLFANLCHRSNEVDSKRNYSGGDARHEGNLYTRCMRPIREMCLQKAERQLLVEAEVTIPCVNPHQQQERLSLFASHVFSNQTTATLSRLLLYDESTLVRVWGVWQNDGLLTSLQFPFALPSAATAGSTTAAGVFVALVMAAAGALCEARGWAEWRQRDNALEELLAVLHVPAEDFVVCVRALVLENV